MNKALTQWLKGSTARLIGSGIAILGLAGLSVSGLLAFPHTANLGLYASFGMLALLIIVWRQGLGQSVDALRLPFTPASRSNPHRLAWWQYPLIIVGMLAYGLVAAMLLHAMKLTTVGNDATAHFSGMISVLFASLPQVGIEELVILPLLLIIATLTQRLVAISDTGAIGIGLVISTLAFVVLHGPAYQWHWGQMLLVIGGSRLILSTIFLKSRSIGTTFIIHYSYDASLLIISVLAP